jgi:hypothetical protein
MKQHRYFLFIVLISCCAFFQGCKKEEADEQAKGQSFTPRIFNEIIAFPESRDSVRVMNVGDTLPFNGLQYSPGGKVKIAWKVNDSTVSAAESYSFVAKAAGDFRIRVEVSYEGTTISRYRDVFVIPGSYTKKTATHIVMAYISDTAGYKHLDFNVLTHVTYKVATVSATGAIDVSKGEAMRKAEQFTGRAHLNGVPVLMGISGALSGDGWSVSQSNNLGAVLTDVSKRAVLVQFIKNYIAAKRMDGVDIMMADINAATPVINANLAALGPLVTELRTALGATALITVTVSGNQYADRYPDLSAANWLNVHAFEDGAHVGPGKTPGQPSGFDYFVTCAGTWTARYPATKIVMGIPAFGLRYNALDANGNNLSWTSYNYIPYKEILAAVPAAAGKEYAEISKGVYYNGLPLVTKKAGYLQQNGFLGTYIWAGEYDVMGASSLTATIFNILK